MNRFAAYADNGGMPFEKSTSAKSRKPKPKSRFADYEGVDEEGFIPNSKRENNMTDYDYDTSRGPYHAILDKMARAHQAITGDSYAKSFTHVYTDPANAAIRDGSKYDDLAKAFDSVHGTAHSLVKAAPPDPPQDDVEPGSANQELHELVVTRMKKNPRLSDEQSFTHEYLAPENRGLKNRVDAEGVMHTRSLAPVSSFPPYTAPGHANAASSIGRSGVKPAGYAGG
jgi:hypothetical protein